MTAARKVALVLGAGAARGFAHIGVIRWLIDNGYVIKSIAGASMGALIGGTHAAGKLDVFADWVRGLDRREIVRLLDPAFDRTGLFRGERIMDQLRTLIGDCEIADLPISFTAVAMDLDTGGEVWFRTGRLFDAIRASIAIPLLLTPSEHDHRRLVDGGLINPVPISAVREDDADLTVVVSLGGFALRGMAAQNGRDNHPNGRQRPGMANFIESLHLSYADDMPSPGIIDITLRAMEAMQDTIGRLSMAACKPDVRIEIPRTACRMHEFWRAEELIALGGRHAEQAFAQYLGEEPVPV